jgi:hypothetical protein
MPTLFFSDRETLRLALASGGVPQAVTRAPAVAGHDEKGRLWLTTQAWLHKDALITLSRFGVQIVGSSRPGTEKTVCCWQEILPLERETHLGDMAAGPVLFDLPNSRFASVAAQIDRLGRHPWFYCWADDAGAENGRVWLKTTDPPYSRGGRERRPCLF